MSEHDEREPNPRETEERLVSVRRVDDEATGLMLAEFLRDQGIEATIHTVRMPWMGGVEQMHRGFWGHVEVLERDAARARSLLEDFAAARPEAPSPEDDDPGGDVREKKK
jgi:hypothetical protein